MKGAMTIFPLYPDSSYSSPHDYGLIRVQGGEVGVVLVRGGPHYTTAFVECFPAGSFLRGEGASVSEADDACWDKLQAYLNCPGHDWEPRQYANGSGVCRVCGQYGSEVLTAEDLGYACTVCGSPTFHVVTGSKDGEHRCEEHDPKCEYGYAAGLAMFHGFDAQTRDMSARLDAVTAGDVEDDPEALEWAHANLNMTGHRRKEDPR